MVSKLLKDQLRTRICFWQNYEGFYYNSDCTEGCFDQTVESLNKNVGYSSTAIIRSMKYLYRYTRTRIFYTDRLWCDKYYPHVILSEILQVGLLTWENCRVRFRTDSIT